MKKCGNERDWVLGLAGELRAISGQADIITWFKSALTMIVLVIGFLALSPLTLTAETRGLEITGDGVAHPLSFTLEELEGMEQYQQVYSTINTWPTKRWYVGQGVKLRDLLDKAGIKADAKMIVFTSSDGYSVNLTVKELLKDQRYYFPGLQENNATDGSIPGSSDGAREAEPILALLSAEGSSNPEHMNDMNGLLFICGQRAVTEQTNNLFLKQVSKIQVLSEEPPQWDKPQVNIGSGEVPAGTLLELNTKGSDADKIYFTTDGSIPTINSPMFNWSAKRWWSQRPDTLSTVNQAIEIKEGTVIKAITIGPGKADSEVVTFVYKIGNPDQAQTPGGPPTSITLDEESIQLKLGGSFELAATVGPDNSEDKRVIWYSSDTSVAVVDHNGLVTLVGPGSAIITAKTADGGLSADCVVSSPGQRPPALDGIQGEENSIINEEQEEAIIEVNPGEAEKIAAEMRTTPGQGREKLNETEEQSVAGQDWQYLISKEMLDASPVSLEPETGGQSWQVFEIYSEAEPIYLPLPTDWQRIYMMLICLLLFLYGAGRRYLDYTKEAAR
jgi:hypothetical protein